MMNDLNNIWQSQKNESNNIVENRINETGRIKSYVGTNLILDKIFYRMSVDSSVTIPDLNQFHFRGLQVFSVIRENENDIYIDLVDDELRSIFIKFIEDVALAVEESESEKDAVQQTVQIILRWKKLFDKISFGGLSLEQQKGLIGELLFFDKLLVKGHTPSVIIASWTADAFKDKDFVLGNSGYEIKFTTAKNPVLRITSERQLDGQTLSDLTVALFIAEEVMEGGFSLNSLVSSLSSKLKSDVLALDAFTKCLLSIGYLVEDAEHYGRMYKLKKSNYYRVSEDFPCIVSEDLKTGLKDVSYCIELSAAEPFLYEF